MTLPVEVRSQESEIEDFVRNLSRCNIQELREHWKRIIKTTCPAAFGPDLLRRRIAFTVQEEFYGSYDHATQRELAHLAKQSRQGPLGDLSFPQQIKPGSVLVRTWKGKSHRVEVRPEGFQYLGKQYSTLSEIAREITSTRWNGPRFFGLRNGKTNKPAASSTNHLRSAK